MLLGFGYLYKFTLFYFFFFKKQEIIDFKKATWPTYFFLSFFFKKQKIID